MPPQHNVSASIRIISDSDPAWDSDRIKAEFTALGPRGNEHPFFAYLRGETRFDLDAPMVLDGQPVKIRDYLKPDVQPIVWLCRRLRGSECAQLTDIGGRDGDLRAFRKAYTGVENGPIGLVPPAPGLAREISEAEADKVAEFVGLRMLFEVGASALLASQAPMSAEKKL